MRGLKLHSGGTVEACEFWPVRVISRTASDAAGLLSANLQLPPWATPLQPRTRWVARRPELAHPGAQTRRTGAPTGSRGSSGDGAQGHRVEVRGSELGRVHRTGRAPFGHPRALVARASPLCSRFAPIGGHGLRPKAAVWPTGRSSRRGPHAVPGALSGRRRSRRRVSPNTQMGSR